ncbi:transmembrane channel-like protein 7 [Dendronephthya gigantea]|uniref:transmembrane channel-like protein 7 n=1 Tax=Dendronephthya gigantea TaxID=151771 RepID=UPI00106C0B29|nr:transmembrane channel-like protein 7 [Dendronephthya gigantea]
MHNSRVAPFAVQTESNGVNTSNSMATYPEGHEELQLDSAGDDDSNDEEGLGNSRSNKFFQGLPSHIANRNVSGPSQSAGLSRGRLQRSSSGRASRSSTRDFRDAQVVDIEDEDQPAESGHSSYKAMAAPMATKRSVRKARMTNAPYSKNLSCWKGFKLRTAMWWHHTKQSINEGIHAMELWKGHLKEVEGQFGNGVLSFFLFLKWLLFLDILIFIIQFCFISIPKLTYPEPDLPSNTSCSVAYDNSSSTEKDIGNLIVDFMTGQGWINTTIMFYSSYPAAKLVNEDSTYKLPLAYLLGGAAYLVLSLLLMVSSLAKNFQQSYIEGGGQFYSFCNKAFASWDFCITDEKTAKIRSQNFFNDIEGTLSELKRLEEIKNRSRKMKFKLYTVRFLVSVVVMGILAASIYGIFVTTEIALAAAGEGQGNLLDTVKRYASSLTISALNLFIPPVFAVLCTFEQYSPSFELAMNLLRTVLLKLASVASLVITLFIEAAKRDDCENCWENQIAAQMYMLVWLDFIIVLFTTLIVDLVYRLLFDHTKFKKFAPAPEFDIPRNVLELVYGQALIWIGCYFSPLMAAMGVIKLFIMFYAKKIGLMYNCKPSSKPYNSSRANYLFTMLLLLSYLICLVAIGYSITRIKTSCCGPFSNTNCDDSFRMYNVIPDEINTWPQVLQDILRFIGTVSFIFPFAVILCLLLYYFRSMNKAHQHMIDMLKDQLILEGRDKRFLMERLLADAQKKQLAEEFPTNDIPSKTTVIPDD